MTEKPDGQFWRLQRFVLLVFFGGWIVAIVAFALLMRAWIPELNLEADLAAIEEADTDRTNLGALPTTLQPLKTPPSIWIMWAERLAHRRRGPIFCVTTTF